MPDQKANDILRVQEQLESNRGVWNNHWREVAERVRPTQNMFDQPIRAEGDKRNERMFDSTAPLALQKWTAAVASMAFPANQKYHKLTTEDPDLAENVAVKRYLERVNDVLFRVRYAPRANFQAQSSEMLADVGSFGTGILFIDDAVGLGIRYKSIPLSESYICEDAHGVVDRLHRKFQLTAQQAVSLFGSGNLSEGVRRAAEKTPLSKFWFVHAVGKNDEYSPSKRLHPTRGKQFYSCYIEYETRSTIEESGFRTFPFAVPRYETAPNETYGRGPAMMVLPTIKMLNEMKKTIIRAAQNVVAPPLMLMNDASLSAFNMRPNALNYGYLDSQGRPMAVPLETRARVDIGIDLMQQEREIINDAFLVTLFRILVEEPQITATEAMLRAQEKGQLIGPTIGRVQSEALGPMIMREIDILAMNGALPEMPDELRQAGGEFKIEYQSPLNQAQRAGEGVAIMNTLTGLAPLAQIDPGIMLAFDIEGAARMVAEINGMPAALIRSQEEVTALKDAQAEQAQAQQLLEAAPVAASAAKDFAQAGAIAASSPNQIAPNLGL